MYLVPFRYFYFKQIIEQSKFSTNNNNYYAFLLNILPNNGKSKINIVRKNIKAEIGRVIILCKKSKISPSTRIKPLRKLLSIIGPKIKANTKGVRGILTLAIKYPKTVNTNMVPTSKKLFRMA